MRRITQKQLENLVDRINKVTKSPATSWTKTTNAGLKANICNYYLDYAYGGVKLVRMVNGRGGIEEISCGYGTKRELYEWMHAFLCGIAQGQVIS